MNTPKLRLVALFVAVFLGLVLWRSWLQRPLPEIDAKRNVILIIIDTLRADHMGLYGYQGQDTTPRLDAFAQKGRFFSRAYSVSSWTPPSIMSLMTSLYPGTHGLNLDGITMGEYPPKPSEQVLTLAQRLGQEGFKTAAFTAGGGMGSVYGFDRGFDLYYEPAKTPKSDIEEGTGRALQWLSQNASEQFFLVLHTYEVHLPNTHPPLPTRAKGVAEKVAAGYDGDLYFADRVIGDFLLELEKRELLDKSIVIVTSDHGENLHDRRLGGRWDDHGHHLHDELLSVPMLWVAPGLIAPDGEIEAGTSSLDIVPTVLSFLGLGLQNDPVQGTDMRHVIQGREAMDPERSFFAEATLHGPQWAALRRGQYKLMFSPGVPGEHWWNQIRLRQWSLFNWFEDPTERQSQYKVKPELSQELKSEMQKVRKGNARLRRQLGEPIQGTKDIEQVESLRALGYLESQ